MLSIKIAVTKVESLCNFYLLWLVAQQLLKGYFYLGGKLCIGIFQNPFHTMHFLILLWATVEEAKLTVLKSMRFKSKKKKKNNLFISDAIKTN